MKNKRLREIIGAFAVVTVCICLTACSRDQINLAPKEADGDIQNTPVVLVDDEAMRITSAGWIESLNGVQSEASADTVPVYTNTVAAQNYQLDSADEMSLKTASDTAIVTIDSDGMAIPQTEFQVELLKYHPGVPGYDLVYDFKVTFQGLLQRSENFTITSNQKDVTVEGSRVIIPESVRNSGEILTLTATYLPDPRYKCELNYEFRQWKLTLEDTFDTLNADLWTAIDDGDASSGIIPKASGCYVKDGKLMLETGKEEHRGVQRTSAYIETRHNFSQRYGVFSSRVKMPERGNMLGAFWLMPDGQYRVDNFYVRNSDLARCSEIDIVEHWEANSSRVAIGHHYWEDVTQNYLGADSLPYDLPAFEPGKFYEYTCVWTKYALYYYIDGVFVDSIQDIHPDNSVEAYIVYSCYPGVEGNWYGVTADEDFGSLMEVDWLRVYA